MTFLSSSALKKGINLFLTFLFFSTSTCPAGCTSRTKDNAIFSADSIRDSVNIVPPAGSQKIALTDTTGTNHLDFASLSIDQMLQRMSLKEKIGQLFFVRSRGYFENKDSDEYRKLLKKIRDDEVGGITFFKGTVYGQSVLTNDLQKQSKIPLWISQDMEFGAAMRIEGTTRITPAMGIGATGNPNNAYWAGRITANEAKAVGVNQIFAPDLDVNNNPRNPVINVRSFSGDPHIVANFGQRFVEGATSEGIVSTGKHFPGHGDTDTDSHYALPVIKSDYARLDSVELVPFRAAVDDGLPSVMSAHINFPNISKNRGRPSTLDPSILKRILVDSLKFHGMVVTDALEMRGISSYYSPGKAVILALKAGADIMLLSPDELTAIHEVEQAVHDSTLSEERINQSVRKLLKWKKKAGLFNNAQIDINRLSTTVHSAKSQWRADNIARQSLTLLKNSRSIIPINPRRFRDILVLSVSNSHSGEAGAYLARQMRRFPSHIRFDVFDRRTDVKERNRILHDARWADLIVIGSYIGINSSNRQQFSSRQLSLLKRLSVGTPKVLITLGNPYAIKDLPDADVQLLAWDDSKKQIRNIVPALFGQSAINGKLPINIPGLYKIGFGLHQSRATKSFTPTRAAGLSPDSLQKIDDIMQKAIHNSTFPGGVVGVVKDGMLAYCTANGYRSYNKRTHAVPNDVYDLASLTKVVATTTSIMKLVDEGKIHLSDHVSKYIPEFSKGEKSKITIRELLLHISGLPADRVYINKLKTRKEIINAVKNEPLINKPGTKYVYSDLGFILLGRIVEKASGMRIDDYTRKMFYGPLGMNSTYYNPKSVGSWLTSRIPPTENDTTYRHKLMQAEVHDERAWYLDGVAGHAGLFSSVQDLAIFAQMLLNKGSYAGKQYISPQTIETFTKKESNINNRGYGFDRKSPAGFSTAGSLMSKQTFGHLGFTGTSMWIDPKNNIAVIMLTNRVNPYRSYGKHINQIRAAVADAVMSSIIDQ